MGKAAGALPRCRVCWPCRSCFEECRGLVWPFPEQPDHLFNEGGAANPRHPNMGEVVFSSPRGTERDNCSITVSVLVEREKISIFALARSIRDAPSWGTRGCGGGNCAESENPTVVWVPRGALGSSSTGLASVGSVQCSSPKLQSKNSYPRIKNGIFL